MFHQITSFISKQRLVIGLTVFVLSVIAMTSALLYTGVNRGASTSKAECFDWGCNITESLGDDSPWSFWGWGRGDGDIYMVDDNTRSGGEGGGGGGQVEDPRIWGPNRDKTYAEFTQACNEYNSEIRRNRELYSPSQINATITAYENLIIKAELDREDLVKKKEDLTQKLNTEILTEEETGKLQTELTAVENAIGAASERVTNGLVELAKLKDWRDNFDLKISELISAAVQFGCNIQG